MIFNQKCPLILNFYFTLFNFIFEGKYNKISFQAFLFFRNQIFYLKRIFSVIEAMQSPTKTAEKSSDKPQPAPRLSSRSLIGELPQQDQQAEKKEEKGTVKAAPIAVREYANCRFRFDINVF